MGAGKAPGACTYNLRPLLNFHTGVQAAQFRVLKPDGRHVGDRCYTCFVDLAVYSR